MQRANTSKDGRLGLRYLRDPVVAQRKRRLDVVKRSTGDLFGGDGVHVVDDCEAPPLHGRQGKETTNWNRVADVLADFLPAAGSEAGYRDGACATSGTEPGVVSLKRQKGV